MMKFSSLRIGPGAPLGSTGEVASPWPAPSPGPLPSSLLPSLPAPSPVTVELPEEVFAADTTTAAAGEGLCRRTTASTALMRTVFATRIIGISLLGPSGAFATGCSSSLVFSAIRGFLHHPLSAKSVPSRCRPFPRTSRATAVTLGPNRVRLLACLLPGFWDAIFPLKRSENPAILVRGLGLLGRARQLQASGTRMGITVEDKQGS